MARHARIKFVAVMLALLLVCQCTFVDAKRPLGGSNRKTSSSSGGFSTRRQSSQTYGGVTKPSSSNSRVGGANQDLARLSYSNQHVQPSRSSSSSNTNTNTNTNHHNSPPIGWNVPPKQGPPPAYSASNPINGARTNNHEAPPSYRPNNSPPPNYASATNTGNAYGGSGTAGAHNTAYRPRANATGGFGAGGFHTPIAATNTHGLQSSNSYPKQQFSPSNTYNAPGNSHPSYGSMPPGTTFYSPGGQLPPGATMYSAPPQGFSNYGHFGGGNVGPGGYGMPAGGGGSYYPSSAVPMGTPFIPAGGVIPAGATMLSAPPQKSSSGLGFGSGLLAGAATGAVLGHIFTPTNTRVIEHVPVASGGSSGGGGGGGDNNDGKIIIINNGQPATVTNQDGATIITTGGVGGGQQQQQPPPSSSSPGVDAGSSVPLAPLAPAAAAAAAVPAASAIADPIPAPAMPQGGVDAASPAAGPAAPGNIVCMQLPFNETDPNDATKIIEVTKIACFPAPTQEQQQAEAAAASKSGSAESLTMQDGAGNMASTTRTGATEQPVMEGSSASIPLAPLTAPPSNAGAQQLRQTDGQLPQGLIMNSDNTPVLRATGGGAAVGGIGSVSNKQFTISAFVTIIIAYYLY